MTHVSIHKVHRKRELTSSVFKTALYGACGFCVLTYIGLVILTIKETSITRQMNIEMMDMRTEITKLQTDFYQKTKHVTLTDGEEFGMVEPNDAMISYMILVPNEESVAKK